jgi:RNA polymerase sigma factor (sigma-70 family)
MHLKTDTELIRAYAETGDEAAFRELVSRHQQMVFRTCFRLLGHTHDAEEAVQATFLVLSLKAGGLRREGDLGGWLHGVARNVGLQVLRGRQTRLRRQGELAMNPPNAGTETVNEEERRAVLSLVDEELGRLSAPLREAVILLYLRGLSQKEAIAVAGCPQGTLGRRASDGIARLRQRLARRGVALSGTALAALLSGEAQAAVPETLLLSVLAAVKGVAAGTAATTAASSGAVALATGAMKAMMIAKLKVAATIAGGVLLVTSGVRLAAQKLDIHGDPIPADAVSRLGTIRLRHVGGGTHQPIAGLSLSGDGLRAVTTAEWDATLRIWDTQTGAPVAAMKVENAAIAARAALSPDGGKVYAIVTSNRDPVTHNYGSWLIGWDVGAGTEIVRVDAMAPFALSPDGARAAVASRQDLDAFDLIDLPTGKIVRSFKGHGGRRGPGSSSVSDLAWSVDGKMLCSAGEDNQAVVWNAATGQAMKKLAGNQAPRPVDQGQGGQGRRESSVPVDPLAISPDGTMLATADLNCAIIRRLSDGKVLHTITPVGPPPTEWIDPAKAPLVKRMTTSIVFSPDGLLVATGSSDRSLCIYDLGKAAISQEIRHHAQPRTMAFSGDGKTLWCAGDKTIHALDVATGKPRFDHAGPESAVTRVVFSPDGTRIAVLDWLGNLRLYDAASSKQLWHTPAHPNPGGFRPADGAGAMACVFRHDGKELFTGGGNHKINCWDPETGKLIRSVGELGRIGRMGLPACASDMAITPDGKKLLLNRGWTVSVVSAGPDDQNGGISLPVPVKTGGTYCNVAFTPDGKIAVAGLGSTRVFAWNLATAEPIAAWEARTEHASQQPNTSIEARPTSDGRLIVAATDGYRDLFAWDIASGQQLFSRRLFDRPQPGFVLVSMRLTPDDRLALVSVGRDIVAVELLSGGIVHRYEGHRGDVTTLDISPDGRRLASGSMDATVLTWDLPAPDPARSPGGEKPAADELPALWESLAGEDAAAAWRAAVRMALAGSDAGAFLSRRMAPVKADVDPKVHQAIADLDSDDFPTRERATADLIRIGQPAVGPLKAALKKGPGAEAEARIRDLLKNILPPSAVGQSVGAEMQRLRGVAALEWAGDEVARNLLKQLADGAPGAVLTDQAAAALRRLQSRPCYQSGTAPRGHPQGMKKME